MVVPAAAGFIADGSDPQTWDAVTAAVLAALSAEFTVLAERDAPGGSERRATRFDTFDWRLHKAGLILEYSPARASGDRSGAGGQGSRTRSSQYSRTRRMTSTRPACVTGLEMNEFAPAW